MTTPPPLPHDSIPCRVCRRLGAHGPLIRTGMAVLLAAVGCASPSSTKPDVDHLAIANDRWLHKDYDGADLHASEVLRSSAPKGQKAKAAKLLGLLDTLRGNHAAAVTNYTTALEVDLDATPADRAALYLGRAECRIRLAKESAADSRRRSLGDAESDIQEALRLNPSLANDAKPLRQQIAALR